MFASYAQQTITCSWQGDRLGRRFRSLHPKLLLGPGGRSHWEDAKTVWVKGCQETVQSPRHPHWRLKFHTWVIQPHETENGIKVSREFISPSLLSHCKSFKLSHLYHPYSLHLLILVQSTPQLPLNPRPQALASSPWYLPMCPLRRQ